MLNLEAKIQETFETAVNDPDNIREDGIINWNFVEADIWMSLSPKEISNLDKSLDLPIVNYQKNPSYTGRGNYHSLQR